MYTKFSWLSHFVKWSRLSTTATLAGTYLAKQKWLILWFLIKEGQYYYDKPSELYTNPIEAGKLIFICPPK